MKIIDVHNELFASSLAAGTYTISGNGTGIDLRGYQGILKVILDSGAGTGTLNVKIQDSTDNNSFADIAGKAFAQVTTAESLQSLKIDTRAVKRYIRAVLTIGGSTPTFGLAITVVGQKQIM